MWALHRGVRREDTISILDDQLTWLYDKYGDGELTVEDLYDDDPVLRAADGTLVDTWREGYPYDERLDRDEYDHTKRLLQIELLKLHKWVRATGAHPLSCAKAGTRLVRAARPTPGSR